MDAYRPLFSESDIEATKRREAEEERLAKMTPLDRAKLRRDQLRLTYYQAGMAQTPSDPTKRAAAMESLDKTLRAWMDASLEVERLLFARNGGR